MLTARTGTAWTGGKARTAKAPRRNARPRARHGDSRSSHPLSRTASNPTRIAGPPTRAIGAPTERSTIVHRRRRKVADLEALDPPRIRVDHLEHDAGRMRDRLAAGRDIAGQREHEAAQRVDVLFALLFRQHRSDPLLELLDGGARIGDEAAVRPGQHLRPGIDVMFVVDLADDFLDDVLDRRQSVDAAEL